MALMALHVVSDVGFRYFAGYPLAGTTEIVSRYYMVTLIFLPLAHVQVRNQHINASLFGELLPPRWQVLLGCLTALLMGMFATILGWRMAVEAARATEIHEKIQTAFYFLPAWPARWIPVVAMVLVLLVSIIAFFTQISRFLDWPNGGEAEADRTSMGATSV